MSDYRREMMELVVYLMRRATEAQDATEQDKFRRQAEVLDFIINHPQDFIANVKQNEEP